MSRWRWDRNQLLVAGLSTALVTYSSVVHLLPVYNVVYVPLSVGMVLVLLRLALRTRLSLSDLGLERRSIASGAKWGGGSAVIAVAIIGIGVAVPAFHGFFEDARAQDMSVGLLAYRALVRIPLGTALLEEFAFRGVLFGAWCRIARPLWAAAGSSLVFGLWHIRPSIELLDTNGLALASAGRVGAVAGAIAATTLAGLVFCWLRVRSRSLLAPYIAHAATNSFALVGAYLVTG
ncbi:MAG: type II CAAX endopeptidase family protein [Acidimicrobiia bacterium]|nr:type II CAAX endopeptidase family protein [Acidimicrobiia bacterium]